MIPKEKTKKKTDLRDFTIMLYGLPKIGKSTAASRIDGALFIPTEPGHNSLEIFSMPIVESWEHLLEMLKEISSGKHNYKTIIIDILDNLYQHCADYICKKHGKEHEGDIGYGKGMALIKIELQRVLSKLAALPMGLVLISHCADQETEDRTGAIKIKKVPSFSKAVYGTKAGEAIHAYVTGMVDAILFATIDRDADGNIIRVVKSKPSNDYEAGDRTGLFPDNMLLSDLFNTKGDKK